MDPGDRASAGEKEPPRLRRPRPLRGWERLGPFRGLLNEFQERYPELCEAVALARMEAEEDFEIARAAQASRGTVREFPSAREQGTQTLRRPAPPVPACPSCCGACGHHTKPREGPPHPTTTTPPSPPTFPNFPATAPTASATVATPAIVSQPNFPSPSSSATTMAADSTTLPSATAVPDTAPRDPRACWNCSALGHLTRQCPEPRTKHCRGCGESGYTKAECPHCRAAWALEFLGRTGVRPNKAQARIPRGPYTRGPHPKPQ